MKNIFKQRRAKFKIVLSVFLFLLLSLSVNVYATDYFVDCTGGKDSNNGTSASTAWKTIAKVNSQTFSAGDSILFKRGCVFREQLIVPSSGSISASITFGSYGIGEKPIISGADVIDSNWTIYKNGIYVANVGDLGEHIQLFVDGEYYDAAHYPNSGYLSATKDALHSTAIIDENLTLTPEKIIGATVFTRAVNWNISENKIIAYNSGTYTVTLDGNIFRYDSSTVMRTGYGFFLQNKLWMLDSEKEWFYDRNEGKLYLEMPDDRSPSGHKIEVTKREYGISCEKNYIDFENLAVEKAYNYDVYLSHVNRVKINNLNIYGGEKGIHLISCSNCIIDNNTIKNVKHTGIKCVYGKEHISITNNTLNGIGYFGDVAKDSTAAIEITYADDVLIEGNNISDCGHEGVHFISKKIMLQNNIIDKTNLSLNDAGAVYTSAYQDAETILIKANIITNSIGNLDGVPAQNKSAAHGIYLDDGTHGATVEGNTISNCDFGIFIHAGHDNTVTGNVVTVARRYAFYINEAGKAATIAGVVKNNIVNNNIFESVGMDATAFFYSNFGDTSSFGTFYNNSYYHPNSDYVISNQSVNFKTISAWRSFSGNSTNSRDFNSRYLITSHREPPKINMMR